MTHAWVGRVGTALFAVAGLGATSLGCSAGSTPAIPTIDSGTVVADSGPAGVDTGFGGDTFAPDLDSGSAGDTTAPEEDATAPDSAPVLFDTGPWCSLPLMPPTFTPATGATGSGYSGLSVTITDPNTPAAGPDQIYYTLDGTLPTTGSQLYLGAIDITSFGTTTVIAIVVGPQAGCPSSAPADATYTVTYPPPPIDPGGNAPVLTALDGTTQNNDFLVTATDFNNTATICFTTDGSTPACSNGVCEGTSQRYDGSTQIPVNAGVTNPLTGQVTIDAIACEAGFPNTTITTLTATLQTAPPTMVSPSPGPQPFTTTGFAPTLLSATTPSAPSPSFVIRYTLAPAAPPTCDTGTIALGPPGYVSAPVACTGGTAAGCAASGSGYASSQTFQAIACKTGYAPSPVVSFTYGAQLNPPALPAPGYLGAPGATYDYTFGPFSFTTDGSATATNDPNYGAADLWYCYTEDATTPACGAAKNTCAFPGDQFVAIVSAAAPATFAQAAPWVSRNQTLEIIACSDRFLPSSVTTGVYGFQLDRPALLGNSLGPAGPGCTGTTASNNACVQLDKTSLTAVVTSYAIPNLAVGLFTAGVQQDFGVAVPGTTFMPYDFACASASGTAACGPLGPTPSCAKGMVVTNQASPYTFNDAGALLGGANTVQVGQTWTVQGCCSLAGARNCNGAFSSSQVSTIVFPADGVAASPLVGPGSAGPLGHVTAVPIVNVDPMAGASTPSLGMALCFSSDGTTPGCAAGVCSGATTAAMAVLPSGAASPVEFAVVETPTSLGAATYTATVATAANIVNGGSNQGVVLTSGGSGYPSPPTVLFSPAPAGGTTATGTATLTPGLPGAVTGIVVTDAGSGYVSPPSITLAGGGGSGAAAMAYLGNTGLVTGQQTSAEQLRAVACSSIETPSALQSQTLAFQLATPDLTLAPTPSTPTGGLDSGGTVAAGLPILVSTGSNFSGESLWYNTGSVPTDCTGAHGGVKLSLTYPAGCTVGGSVGQSCTGELLTLGGATSNTASNVALPTSGNTLVVNVIACPEASGPSQQPSAVRSATLALVAAQPQISSSAGNGASAASAGPVTTVYDNVVTATLTDPTSLISAVQICYRLNGTTPSCTGGVCDPNSSVTTIAQGAGNGASVIVTNAPGTGTQLVAVACVPGSSPLAGLAQSPTASATYTLDVSPIVPVPLTAADVCPQTYSVGLDCAGFVQAGGTACLAAGQACTVADQATTCCSGSCDASTLTCSQGGPYCSAATLAAQGPTANAWICYSITGTVPQSNCYGPAAGNPPSGVPSDVTCFNTTTGATVNSAAGQTFLRSGGGQYVSEVLATVNPTTLNAVSCATGTAAQAVGLLGASAEDIITPKPFDFTVLVNGDLAQFVPELAETQLASNDKPNTGGAGATDAYMSYDTMNLFFAYGGAVTVPNNEDPSGALSASQLADPGTYVAIYLGNATGEGATVGPASYNPTPNPTLPVVSSDVILWEVSVGQAAGAATALTYNGSAWVTASYAVTVGYESAGKVSFSIPLAGFGGAANGPAHITMFGQTLLGVGSATVSVFDTFPTSAAMPLGYSNFVNANRSSCLGPAQQLNQPP